MRPICVQCKCHYRPKRNGYEFVTTMNDGAPYQLWRGDLWACPECGHETVIGFGHKPVAEHFQPTFKAQIEARPLLMVRP